MSGTDERRRWALDLIWAQPPQRGKLADPGGPANVADLLRRVCGAAVVGLPASGAGVSVMTVDGSRGFAAASDPSSQQLEDLQFTLGEGPCIDAYATRRPVLVPNLGDGPTLRWPVYAPAVLARGVRAVFAFPLQIGAGRLGVLDVFREQAGQLTEEELAQALTFAEIALTVVLDGQERAPSGEVPAGFEEGAGFVEISQAQGMVMVQLGVTITEALVRLRARAYTDGRPVGDVARDVIARRLRFDNDR